MSRILATYLRTGAIRERGIGLEVEGAASIFLARKSHRGGVSAKRSSSRSERKKENGGSG